MKKEYKQKIVIFGHEYDYDYICPTFTEDILQEALEKVKTYSEPDIDYLLSILQSVSRAWSDPEYHIRKKASELLQQKTSFSLEMIGNSLDYISSRCNGDLLSEKIFLELGNFDSLRNENKKSFEDDEDEGFCDCNYLKVKPKGIVLHICSGNKLYFDIIGNWVTGIVTKNINILKVDSDLLPLFLLFLESIKEFDPSGVIWTNQAVLCWDDYDDKINDIFFNYDLTILFQGKKDLLDHYKIAYNLGSKLIDYSLKYSFSIIEGKNLKPDIPSDVINGLAMDICQWNQKTPYSPHVVYILDKDLKTSHQFIESLFDEMIAVCEDYPCGNLSFDEKVEIRKIRETARMMQVKGEGRLVCPEDFSFTLILDYNPAFKLSCLNRTLYIKRVSNLESLMEMLFPLSSNICSVSLLLSDETKKLCVNELLKLGVKHFSHLGKAAESLNVVPRNGLFLMRELSDFIYFDDYSEC